MRAASIWWRLLRCWKKPRMTVQYSVRDAYEQFSSLRSPTRPTRSGFRTCLNGSMKPLSAFSASA